MRCKRVLTCVLLVLLLLKVTFAVGCPGSTDPLAKQAASYSRWADAVFLGEPSVKQGFPQEFLVHWVWRGSLPRKILVRGYFAPGVWTVVFADGPDSGSHFDAWDCTFADTNIVIEALDKVYGSGRSPSRHARVRPNANAAPIPCLGVEFSGPADATGGAQIANVLVSSPAALAGIVPGDTVLTFNRETVADASGLHSHIRRHLPGDTFEVEVLRQEGRFFLVSTLGHRQTLGCLP